MDFMGLLNQLSSISPSPTEVADLFSEVMEIIGIIATATGTAGMLGVLAIVIITLLVVLAALILLVVFVVLAAVFLVVALLASHAFCALPTFVLAVKKKSKLALLALLPLPYFKPLVQCDIPGKEPLKILGETLALKHRLAGYVASTLISLFGNVTISAFISLFLVLLTYFVAPGLCQVVSILTAVITLIPVALVAYYNFLTLRDILDAFQDNRIGNLLVALVATLVDTLFLQVPLVRTLSLYRILFKKPQTAPDPLVVEAEEAKET